MTLLVPLLGTWTAAAATGLSGSEGVFDVPTPHTVAPDQMTMSLALRTVGVSGECPSNSYPVGISVGLSQRLGVGFSLNPLDPTLAEGPISITNLSARLALVRPPPGRPALSMQAEVERFELDPVLNLVGIVGADLRHLSPTLALGPRWHSQGGLGATLGGGVTVPVKGPLSALAETTAIVNPHEMSKWLGRGGLSYQLGYLVLSAWGEGGVFVTRQWLGGGLALSLSSKKPTRAIPAPRSPEGTTDVEGHDTAESSTGLIDGEAQPAPENTSDSPNLRLKIHPVPRPTGERLAPPTVSPPPPPSTDTESPADEDDPE